MAVDALHRLEALVGAEVYTTDPTVCQQHAFSGRVPRAVVFPRNAAEIAEILRFCSQHRLAVVPLGAGSKGPLANPPERYDLALVSSRLRGVIFYDPGDLTLSVEAGLSLHELERLVATEGQFFPLAAPFGSAATVGGAVASGLDSPWRQFYGTARDLLLGAEFVTGDGLVAHSGGRVVKNVAGYDLHKLLIGSWGTLGVLTRLNFRTYPHPGPPHLWLARYERWEDAAHLLRRLRGSVLRPLAADLLSGWWAERLLRQCPAGQPSFKDPSGLQVVVDFRGSAAVRTRIERELRTLAEQTHATAAVLLAEEAAQTVASAWRELLSQLLVERADGTLFRLGALPTTQPELAEAIQALAASSGVGAHFLVRAAGPMWLALLPEEQGWPAARWARLLQELRQLLQNASAHGTLLYAPASAGTREATPGDANAATKAMQALKDTFDPQHILAPGRLPTSVGAR